jgi:hypothetical protein
VRCRLLEIVIIRVVSSGRGAFSSACHDYGYDDMLIACLLIKVQI